MEEHEDVEGTALYYSMYSSNGAIKYKDPYSVPFCTYHFSQKGCALCHKCNFSHGSQRIKYGYSYEISEIPRAKDIRPKIPSAERKDAPLCPYYISKKGCALGYKCNYFHDKNTYERLRGKYSWTKLSHKIKEFDIKPIVIGDFIWYREKDQMVQYDSKLNMVMKKVPIPETISKYRYSYCKYLNHIYLINSCVCIVILFDPSNDTFSTKYKV